MTRTHVRSHTDYIIEHEGREFEVSFEPVRHDDPTVKLLPDGRAVVGWLVQDDDCPHPLEDCDGVGKIIGRGKYATRDHDEAEFYTALGINEYGTPVCAECGCTREDHAKDGVGRCGSWGCSCRKFRPAGDPYAVLLDVYDHSGLAWAVGSTRGGWPDERWDVSNGAGVWVPDESCREHIGLTAAQEAVCPTLAHAHRLAWHAQRDRYPRPPCTPPPAETPAVRVTFGSRSAAGPDGKTRYWSTYGWKLASGRKRGGYKTPLAAARGAARAVGVAFDAARFDTEARAEAIRCAESAVDEYNKWLSGDCYGVCTQVFGPDNEPVGDEEACWGYIGGDYAEQELAAEVERTVEGLLREDAPES